MLVSLHPYYNYTLVVSAVTIEEGPYSVPVTVITAQDGKQINTSIVWHYDYLKYVVGMQNSVLL